MTQQEQIPEDVARMMKEQKVKMAKERMAENREEQLDHVRREAEYQDVVMRERREMEARQMINRDQELGVRPRTRSYQPYLNQLQATQNRLQEEEMTRTAAYRDQYAQYRRNGGM